MMMMMMMMMMMTTTTMRKIRTSVMVAAAAGPASQLSGGGEDSRAASMHLMLPDTRKASRPYVSMLLPSAYQLAYLSPFNTYLLSWSSKSQTLQLRILLPDKQPELSLGIAAKSFRAPPTSNKLEQLADRG